MVRTFQPKTAAGLEIVCGPSPVITYELACPDRGMVRLDRAGKPKMAGLDTCGIRPDGLEKIGVGPVTCEKACHYFEQGPPLWARILACLSKFGAQPNIAATIYLVSERATSERGQVHVEGF